MKKIVAFAALSTVFLGTVAGAMTMQHFTDQESFAPWFATSVEKMQYNNIITGYPDGSFGPDKGVSRAELAVMLDRFATALGQELGPRACTKQLVYGLTLFVQDQHGNPVAGAPILFEEMEEEVPEMTGEEGYAILLPEAAGYHTMTIAMDGYSTHQETIKLDHDGCHVIPQVRTVTIIALEE